MISLHSMTRGFAVVVLLVGCIGCSVQEETSPTYEYTRAALGTAGLADTILPNESSQVYVVSAGEAAKYAQERGFTFSIVNAKGSCADIEFTDSKPWYTGSVQLAAGSDISHQGSACEYSLFGSRPLAAGWRFVRVSSYSNGRVVDEQTGEQWAAHHDFSSVCQQKGKCGTDSAWTWRIISEPEFGSDSLEIIAGIDAKPGVQGRLSLKRLHLMGPPEAEWQQAFQ